MSDILQGYAEIVPSGYTRRQYRDGILDLVSRIDKMFSSLPTHLLLRHRASGGILRSIFDDSLPSDHAPISITLSDVVRQRAARLVPRWVSAHPLFHRRLTEAYDAEDWAGVPPFVELAERTAIIRDVAWAVVREAREPGPSHTPHWRRHWVSSARSAWEKGELSRVAECIARVPDAGPLFMTDAGALLQDIDEDAVAQMLNCANRDAVAEDLRRDLAKMVGDDAKSSLRSRATRRLAQWAPARRRLVTQIVLRLDGNIAADSEEAHELMRAHWSPISGNASPIDDGAADLLLRKVQRWVGDLALPSIADFQRMVERTTSSAPGPDMLDYSFWAAHESNISVLYSCLEALWRGEPAPEWFNEATVIFIPKAAVSPTDDESRAEPGRYRPLTLANASQTLLAKAITSLLEEVAVTTVSPLQRGFVRGRQILDNVFDVECAMELALLQVDSDPGIFLFDVEAAFPSASQAWIWRVMYAMELPRALCSAVQALYCNVRVRFLVGGVLSAYTVDVVSGIKQGCPSSGSLWALLYDLVIRNWGSILPTSELTLGCFADDLAAAARSVHDALPALLRTFDLVRTATRLRLNIRKTALVYFGPSSFEDVSRRLSAHTGGQRLPVSGKGIYLGVPIGPDSFETLWHATTDRMRKVVRHISGLHATLGDRIRAHRVFGQSVPGYLLQLRRLDAGLTRTDRAGLAVVLAAPMHSMGPGLLPHVVALGGRTRLPEIGTISEASMLRCCLRHSRLEDLLQSISEFALSDAAALAPRRPEWSAGNSLSSMRAARARVKALPARIRDAGSLQKAIQRHLERSSAVRDLQGWYARRASHLWGYAPPDGQSRLFFARIRMLFRALPDFVFFARLRTLGNAWLTSRRMSRHVDVCKFGCYAVGGDCIRHYFLCPAVADAIRQSRARPPCWLQAGHIGLVTFAVPLPEEEVLRVGMWNYTVYLAYTTARRQEDQMEASSAAELFRACIRSAVARAPAARRILAPP